MGGGFLPQKAQKDAGCGGEGVAPMGAREPLFLTRRTRSARRQEEKKLGRAYRRAGDSDGPGEILCFLWLDFCALKISQAGGSLDLGDFSGDHLLDGVVDLEVEDDPNVA